MKRLPFEKHHAITQNFLEESRFKYECDPEGKWRHNGVDFATPVGTPILPIEKGKVVNAFLDKSGYGLHIRILHENGYMSIYGHLSKIFVKIGDMVDINTTIALSGGDEKDPNAGRVYGNGHLHLELRTIPDKCKSVIDPLKYIGRENVFDDIPKTVSSGISNETKKIKVLVDVLNVRDSATTTSRVLSQRKKDDILIFRNNEGIISNENMRWIPVYIEAYVAEGDANNFYVKNEE